MNPKKILRWPIGGTTTLFARCHARDGAGGATGYKAEGKYITAAQIAAITCKVYDRDGGTPNTSLGSPTITSAAVVTPVTSAFDGTGRDPDEGAYNFAFDLTSNLISIAGHKYRVSIDITLNTGTVLETMAFEASAQDWSP